MPSKNPILVLRLENYVCCCYRGFCHGSSGQSCLITTGAPLQVLFSVEPPV